MNSDQDKREEYQYESDTDRRNDDRHAQRARDLARESLREEALREAGKLYHYERRDDLIDEVSRRAA